MMPDATVASTLDLHGIGVLAATAVAFVLFAMPRVPIQASALGVLVFIPLAFAVFPYYRDGHAVDPQGFFYGFGHDALIAICGLMLIGQGLVRSGALEPVAKLLARLWSFSPALGLLVVLSATMALSAVVNDTPIIVLMIPVLIGLGQRSNISPARLLLPVNYAVLIGGMATTIGTSTNLLVVSIAADHGTVRFAMFDFLPVVLPAAAVALPYLWLVVPRLLTPREPHETASLRLYDAVLHVSEDSPIVGKTLQDLFNASHGKFRPTQIRRGPGISLVRLPTMHIAAGDRLVLRDTAAHLKAYEEQFALSLHNLDDSTVADANGGHLKTGDQRMAEVVVTPNSPHIGSTLQQLRFVERYGLVVLAIYRSSLEQTYPLDNIGAVPLTAGDVLLVQGEARDVTALGGEDGYLVLDGAIDLPRTDRAPISLAILGLVVLAAAFKILPMYLAATSGVLVMLATRCLRADDLGAAMKSEVILLVASSLALAKAMDVTGVTTFLAEQLVASIIDLPPIYIVGGLMAFVAVLTNFVSNNAAAAIGTPIAVAIAARLGLPAEALVLAIMFGCNLSYATPIGYQTNLLVMSAARYKFHDFLLAGAPLLLLMVGTLTWSIGKHYGLLPP